MNCKTYQREIALWVGNDLSSRRARRLEHHLQNCAACRDYADSFRRHQNNIRKTAAEPLDTELGVGLLEAALSQIQAAPRPRPRFRPPVLVKAAAMAAAVAAILFAIWVFHQPGVNAPPKLAVPPVAANTAPRPIAPSQEPPVRIPQIHKKNPVVMKLLTDDPNVVFVMLSD